MTTKQRLSASVDTDLIQAAGQAVKRGLADSISAWVNDALRLKLAHERRLEALASFVAAYEAEHGAITTEELRLASRRARATAVVVRGTNAANGGGRRRRRKRG
jgi:hypothetical protein